MGLGKRQQREKRNREREEKLKKLREESPNEYIQEYRRSNGSISLRTFIKNEKRHNENGPAHAKYYRNGAFHEREWCINGQRHRLDGPAILCQAKDGSVLREEYWRVGVLHNDDGPAIIYHYGYNGPIKQYWINGTRLTDKQWEDRQFYKGFEEELMKDD